jgi:predicted dehydrogenase
MSKRLAWVGTAHIHTPGFTDQVLAKGFECVGVWDHDSERAAKNATKLGGSVASLDELASGNADAFVVCSETNRHPELVEKIAPAGKPMFVEKPVGATADQSRAILGVLQKYKNPFHTGYGSRGVPGFRTIKQKVDEGFFGQITRVRASFCHSGALGGWFDTDWRWMADRSQSGVGALGDLGTHALDLLLWMFGPASAVTGALNMGTARYAGCDEAGEALICFSSGVIGTLAASWDDVADPIRMQVAGTKGHAVFGSELQFFGPDGKPVEAPLVEPAAAGFAAFLDYLEGKPAELVGMEEASERDVTMDAIYRGAETQTWVSLK